MSVTAKDIATRLGLSQPTVSRILNGTKGYRVAPGTRQRVLETARELGYQPNAVARSLRSRKTNIVGFYTGYGYLDARNDFLAEVIGGLLRRCDHYHLDLLLHGVFRECSTEDIFGELVDGRIDGLFLHTYSDDPLATRIAASSLPVIAVTDSISGIPSVICEGENGTRKLLNRLFEKGYRRFYYIAPELPLASMERRKQAFLDELMSLGLGTACRQVLTIPIEDPEAILPQLLCHSEEPVVACCWNDATAYNLLRLCSHYKIPVPDRIAVIGFDGFLDLKLPSRHLVTVQAPWGAVANNAVDLLVRRMRGETVPDETVFPVTILEGDTA